ncbi:MAG: hypothetical protein AB1405_07750 [Bdellovibrionota bacterium]
MNASAGSSETNPSRKNRLKHYRKRLIRRAMTSGMVTERAAWPEYGKLATALSGLYMKYVETQLRRDKTGREILSQIEGDLARLLRKANSTLHRIEDLEERLGKPAGS